MLFAIRMGQIVLFLKTFEVITMDDGLLLQSAMGLLDPPIMKTEGMIWNTLQDLKEEVATELLAEGPLCQSEVSDALSDEGTTSSGLEIEWRHRSQLEARLLAITDAQDRLLDGTYGKCVECREQINSRRLAADPAVSLCLNCQSIADGEHEFHTM